MNTISFTPKPGLPLYLQVVPVQGDSSKKHIDVVVSEPVLVGNKLIINRSIFDVVQIVETREPKVDFRHPQGTDEKQFFQRLLCQHVNENNLKQQ